jgi:hypothetical protein
MLPEKRRRKGDPMRDGDAATQAAHDAWKLRAAFPSPGRLKTCPPILLSLIFTLWSCTISPPPGYRYQGALGAAHPLTRVSLAGPRVGTVVMMRAVGDAAAEGDAFTAAFQTALADTLRAKGYEPVTLYSGVFHEAIGGVIGGLNAFKHLRAMRPMLEQPVFENPTAREVAGVFVAWVEVRLEVPEIAPGPLGGTFIRGNIPAPAGEVFIEIFTPEGEPLVWTNSPFLGYEGAPNGAPAVEPGGTQVAGSYRVLPPAEIASTEVKGTLALLHPYAGQGRP